jgi:hypothetical protein
MTRYGVKTWSYTLFKVTKKSYDCIQNISAKDTVQISTDHHCAPDAARTKESCNEKNAIGKLKGAACFSGLVQEPTSEARLHHHEHI